RRASPPGASSSRALLSRAPGPGRALAGGVAGSPLSVARRAHGHAAQLAIADGHLGELHLGTIAERDGAAGARRHEADAQRVELEMILAQRLDGHEDVDEGLVALDVEPMGVDRRDAP